MTQDAFLRAFRFIGGFRGDRKFGSWLFSITRNCAMDALGRRRFPLVRDPDLELEAAVGDAAAHAELGAALAAVSPEHREAFLLVEVFGMSYQEAADVLGVAVGTVKSRMFRARKALWQALRATDDEAEAGGAR